MKLQQLFAKAQLNLLVLQCAAEGWDKDPDWLNRGKDGRFGGGGVAKVAKKTAEDAKEIFDSTAKALGITKDVIKLSLADSGFRERAGLSAGMGMAEIIKATSKAIGKTPELEKKIDSLVQQAADKLAKDYGGDKDPLAQAIRKSDGLEPPADSSIPQKMEFAAAKYQLYMEALANPERYQYTPKQQQELVGKSIKASIPLVVDLAVNIGVGVAMGLLFRQSLSHALASAVLGEVVNRGVEKGLDAAGVDDPLLKTGIQLAVGLASGGVVELASKKIAGLVEKKAVAEGLKKAAAEFAEKEAKLARIKFAELEKKKTAELARKRATELAEEAAELAKKKAAELVKKELDTKTLTTNLSERVLEAKNIANKAQGRDADAMGTLNMAFDYIGKQELELIQGLVSIGVDPGLIKKAVDNAQKIIDNAEIAIRVPSVEITELIANNRFLSTFENGVRGDTSYMDLRTACEQKALGISGVSNESRPIYGYLIDSGDESAKAYIGAGSGTNGYGSTAVLIEKSAKDRAAFTGCDTFKEKTSSLMNAVGLRWLFDNEIIVPDAENSVADIKVYCTQQIEKVANSKTVQDLLKVKGKHDYIECQIFGQLDATEVATVVAGPPINHKYFTRDLEPTFLKKVFGDSLLPTAKKNILINSDMIDRFASKNIKVIDNLKDLISDREFNADSASDIFEALRLDRIAKEIQDSRESLLTFMSEENVKKAMKEHLHSRLGNIFSEYIDIESDAGNDAALKALGFGSGIGSVLGAGSMEIGKMVEKRLRTASATLFDKIDSIIG